MKYSILFILLIVNVLACTPGQYTQVQSIENRPIEPFNDGGIFIYENGEWVKSEVDQKPMPLGGENNYLRTMYGQIRYPAAARENGIQGFSVISVVVNELGQQESATIKKRIGSGCDEEALKAVVLGGAKGFEPALKNGKPVKVKYDVPVKFSLE